MALSLDDRLLGEKVHNYCSSSSESEGEDDEDDTGSNKREAAVAKSSKQQQQQSVPEEPARDWRGAASNTGPKGVVEDWRRFKQLEAEARSQEAADRRALAAKFSVACRTSAEDDAEAKLDAELDEAMSEVDAEFLAEYRRRRLEEMRLALSQRKLFGRVVALDRGNFVMAVDKEPADVKVVVHIYDTGKEPACVAVNAGLDWLAERYPTVKFCRIPAGQASVSRQFVARGLPALVVYKAGEVTNSFVGLVKELGDACTGDELEAFLTEYGVLSESLLSDGRTVQQLLGASGGSSAAGNEASSHSSRIRGPATTATALGRDSDSDSDLGLD